MGKCSEIWKSGSCADKLSGTLFRDLQAWDYPGKSLDRKYIHVSPVEHEEEILGEKGLILDSFNIQVEVYLKEEETNRDSA